METLDHALEELSRTRAELLGAIAGLDEAALDRKGVVGEWSIKNVLAHIAAWEDWVVQALPARVSSGVTPEDFRQRAEDEDRFNATEVAEREELTPDEQLMELERTRAELLAYLGGLDVATLARAHLWDTWPGTLPEYLLEALRDHEAEHVEALREASRQLKV
ncbi:MAG TPA: DinB family protein [Roseiflexaceae bacterium]|nr:DinB family protein [Roseiflexaceae bacterium]